MKKAWEKVPYSIKGVSHGGEEFIYKLNNKKKKLTYPNFLTGTLKDYQRDKTDMHRPLFLYFSGDDNLSKKFEE